ncbi:MAG: hypothetical protein HC880_02620 [Bacteroidia bacterium]|nr:hypothetical protein [Bacteroidia bacterium]
MRSGLPLQLILFFLGMEALLVLSLAWYARPQQAFKNLKAKQEILQRFLLSDYCLTTESRHTRHISQTEWMAPFQDLPAYHDHFPSSSFFQASPSLFSPKYKK